jgi:hypothetical protein
MKGARVSHLETKNRSEKTTFSYEDEPIHRHKTRHLEGRMTAREFHVAVPLFSCKTAFLDPAHAPAAIGVS